MQGLGNDYVYINCFQEKVKDPSGLAIAVSDRHFGAGADGLILICPSEKADCRMRMFNADGSEGEMCGNGIRCVGKYVYERGLAVKNPLTVETLAGIKTLFLEVKNNVVNNVTVNMGKPQVAGKKEVTACEHSYQIWDVSMGNPHGVVFLKTPNNNIDNNVENIDNNKNKSLSEIINIINNDDKEKLSVQSFPVREIGGLLEKHPIFPKGANIEFVEAVSTSEIYMRVWERGSGETLACGTGACACAAAGVASGILDRKITVHLLGGDLQIVWNADDNCIYMTGPAEFVYDGVWLREA